MDGKEYFSDMLLVLFIYVYVLKDVPSSLLSIFFSVLHTPVLSVHSRISLEDLQ